MSGPEYLRRLVHDGPATAGHDVLSCVAVALAVGSLAAQQPATADEFNDTHFHLTNYIQEGISVPEALKLLLYLSLIACLFVPWGLMPAGAAVALLAIGILAYIVKLAAGGFCSRCSRPRSPRCGSSACRNSWAPH